MSAESRRARQLIYVGNGVAAMAASACLLTVPGTGVGWWAGSYLPMPWAAGPGAPITWQPRP
jgi:hypothetical protein